MFTCYLNRSLTFYLLYIFNSIQSLSEKFQRSEEIAKLKSFMERNNLSTKLATNNVNGAKWVVEVCVSKDSLFCKLTKY